MCIIIGLDPGSKIIGYGILKFNNNKFEYLLSGSINFNNKNIFIRLKNIYSKVYKIIKKFNPYYSVIEKIFIGKNMDSSIKLCYAKSVIILALMNLNIPIFEYSYIQVKKYVLNGIYFNKNYIKLFIKNKFNLPTLPNSDEADALAIAITHYYINIKK